MADRDGNNIVWFLAGLGIGTVAGILYAPRSGSETREALRVKAEEGRDFVRDRAREAREQAEGWADKGRQAINQQKDQFKSAYEAGRQAYHEATAASSDTTNR
jgi:gas vesicle protein